MGIALQTTYNLAPAIGMEGSLAENVPHVIIPGKNVEASASIPFGRAVCFDLSAPASDYSMLLPAAETDTVAGIVLHKDRYARTWTSADGTVNGELDSTGLVTGTLMDVLRKGRVLVKCRLATAVGDRLWVRAVAGAGEWLGACEQADDSTDTIDCTKQGVFLSSCSALGLAWLEVDFTNKP